MRELVSKVEDGCMFAFFHLASRPRTRAAESYRMEVILGSEGAISREFDWFLASGGEFGKLTGF